MSSVPITRCSDCPVCSQSVFCQACNNEQIEPLKKVVKVKRGECLFKEGDLSEGVYCLQSGRLAILKQGHENEKFLVTASPGEILGVTSVFKSDHYSTTAMAIEESNACLIGKQHFLDLLQRFPKLSYNTIRMMSNKINSLETAQ